MSSSKESSFFNSLLRATTSALQSAQKEFYQEWNGSNNKPPLKVVSATTKSAVVSNKSPSAVTPEKLDYLRSVYLKPPLRSKPTVS